MLPALVRHGKLARSDRDDTANHALGWVARRQGGHAETRGRSSVEDVVQRRGHGRVVILRLLGRARRRRPRPDLPDRVRILVVRFDRIVLVVLVGNPARRHRHRATRGDVPAQKLDVGRATALAQSGIRVATGGGVALLQVGRHERQSSVDDRQRRLAPRSSRRVARRRRELCRRRDPRGRVEPNHAHSLTPGGATREPRIAVPEDDDGTLGTVAQRNQRQRGFAKFPARGDAKGPNVAGRRVRHPRRECGVMLNPPRRRPRRNVRFLAVGAWSSVRVGGRFRFGQRQLQGVWRVAVRRRVCADGDHLHLVAVGLVVGLDEPARRGRRRRGRARERGVRVGRHRSRLDAEYLAAPGGQHHHRPLVAVVAPSRHAHRGRNPNRLERIVPQEQGRLARNLGPLRPGQRRNLVAPARVVPLVSLSRDGDVQTAAVRSHEHHAPPGSPERVRRRHRAVRGGRVHRVQHHRSQGRRRDHQTRRLVAIAQLREGDQLASVALRRSRRVAPRASSLDRSPASAREDHDGSPPGKCERDAAVRRDSRRADAAGADARVPRAHPHLVRRVAQVHPRAARDLREDVVAKLSTRHRGLPGVDARAVRTLFEGRTVLYDGEHAGLLGE